VSRTRRSAPSRGSETSLDLSGLSNLLRMLAALLLISVVKVWRHQ
jgi:hypothetical protein